MARLERRSLSNRVVDGLRAGDREIIYWDRDLPGFGVRVYPNGAKTYLVQGRGPRGSKRITIGRHGTIAADEARRRGAALLIRIKAGEEPGAEPGEGKGPTVAELAERYLREHVEVRCKPLTVKGYRQIIVGHILPALGKLPIAAVGREHVADLHYRLRKTPVAANDTVGALSRMLNRAEAWGLVPAGSNPCRFVTPYRTRRLERFLTEGEFGRLGHALDELEAGGRLPVHAAAAITSSDADGMPLRRGADASVGGRGAGAERDPASRQQDRPPRRSAVAGGGPGSCRRASARRQPVGDRGP